MSETEKKKKKLRFPSSYTVLFIVMIFAAILTFAIPAGKFSKLSYNGDTQKFDVEDSKGNVESYAATQKTLDKFGINAKLSKFTEGSIKKPMAIRGTYKNVPQNGQGIMAFLSAPISGVYDSIDVILFVFMIGGMIGIMNHLGIFNAGISELARVSKGHEQIIIAVVLFLIAMGGTTFGMAEETIAFYPIMIPIFLKSGYDAMTGIAAIWCGSSIGCMFSTVNPFSVVIASNAAGINFKDSLGSHTIGLVIGIIITLIYIFRYAAKVKKDPSKSIIFDSKAHIDEKFGMNSTEQHEERKMTVRERIILLLFFATFVIMVYGVASHLGWWFDQMSVLFLVMAVIIGVVGGMNEAEISEEFVKGAADLVGVALVVGLARAVNILLENGFVSDTLLHVMSGWVSGMNPVLFLIVMELIFIILGFFINSSSGLAMLSIPIMAPLADAVGLPRDLVISAYMYGLGLIGLITPTGLILASLQMVDVTYDKWLKWCWPLMILWTILGIVMLIFQMGVGF